MWQRCIWIPEVAGIVACLFLTAPPAGALTVDLNFDTSSVFFSNPTARASIEQAASDISDAITSALSTVNDYEWFRETTNPGTGQKLESTYEWNFSYAHPTQGNINITPNLAANTLEIAVFGRNFSGSTLGAGGPAGVGFSSDFRLSASDPPGIQQPVLQSQLTTLVNQQSALAQNEYTRGAGPVISNIEGTTSLDFGGGNSASAPYSVSYGPAYGTLALDTSWGGELFTDYWHIDHTAPVPAGKNDLYSVALHEMLHAIGYGVSETWDELSNGTTWLGSEVIDLVGSGSGMVIGGHVATGKTGQNIYTGATQEAVMDPSLTQGTRKYLTPLDLAFLRDLGYQTIVPDLGLDGDFNNDGIVNLADYTLWRDNLGAGDESAINNNGNGGGITSADYTVWKNNFGMMSPTSGSFVASANVPEPSGLVLCLLTWVAVTARRRYLS